MITQSTASAEYIRIPVSGVVNGSVVILGGNPVAFAFLAEGVTPGVSDWHAGTWETYGSTYYARILVGTGGTVLAAGVYHVWIKITDSPEIPARDVELLKIV